MEIDPMIVPILNYIFHHHQYIYFLKFSNGNAHYLRIEGEKHFKNQLT